MITVTMGSKIDYPGRDATTIKDNTNATSDNDGIGYLIGDEIIKDLVDS